MNRRGYAINNKILTHQIFHQFRLSFLIVFRKIKYSRSCDRSIRRISLRNELKSQRLESFWSNKSFIISSKVSSFSFLSHAYNSIISIDNPPFNRRDTDRSTLVQNAYTCCVPGRDDGTRHTGFTRWTTGRIIQRTRINPHASQQCA